MKPYSGSKLLPHCLSRYFKEANDLVAIFAAQVFCVVPEESDLVRVLPFASMLIFTSYIRSLQSNRVVTRRRSAT
jgi:hypothetical protein